MANLQAELNPLANGTGTLGCGQQQKRPTWKILESLPQPTLPQAKDTVMAPALQSHQPESNPSHTGVSTITTCTPPNIFGLYWEYLVTSHIEPVNDSHMLADMSDLQHPVHTGSGSHMASVLPPPGLSHSQNMLSGSQSSWGHLQMKRPSDS